MSATRDDGREVGYALLDAGDGRRLERFGSLVVDRPATAAIQPRRDRARWRTADLRYEPGRGWSGGGRSATGGIPEAWQVEIDSLAMELRPTASGGVGLYPEHIVNLDWLGSRLEEREKPGVLNLFGHTGLATLAAARAGASVAHVDAARSAVAWARRNAELAGVADRPIRWLVDDAAGFVARDARRGRQYDGIVLDPPSFGRARGRSWRLEDELPDLMTSCARILAHDGFVLLTAHTSGIDGDALAGLARDALPSSARIAVRRLELVAESGARLELGWGVRAVLD